MRLETQALSEQYIGSLAKLLTRRPTWLRLINKSQIVADDLPDSLLGRGIRNLRATVREKWPSYEVMAALSGFSAIVLAVWRYIDNPDLMVTMAVVSWFSLHGVLTFLSGRKWNPNVMNCGNLIFLLNGKLPIDQILEILEPSVRDLLDPGLYSFGNSFK